MTESFSLPAYGGIFDLTGKTAVVTGAAGILGKHFSAALAAHGAQVALVDIDGDAVQSLAVNLNEDRPAATRAYQCDVANVGAIAELFEAIVEDMGPVHFLHNNAVTKGASLEAMFEPAETYAPETWREQMSVNLDGAFNVMRICGSLMIQNGGGSIVSTSSIYGLLGADDRIYEESEYLGMKINTPPSYAAAKAGLVGLTRYFAARWGRHGIRANAIAPGGVESGQNDAFKKRYSSRVPLGRMGRPEDLVGALVWLASDASRYVTGQVISIDGGLTAW